MKTFWLGRVGSVALLLSACGVQGSTFSHSDEAEPVAATDSNLPEVEEPAPLEPAPLRWRSCGSFGVRDVRCTEIDVPVDYAAPGAEQLPIAINLIEHNPAAPYRGRLFFNPGGPGASGKEVALAFARAGYFDRFAPGYDIVGFDPRGVAESGDRACGVSIDQLMLRVSEPESMAAALEQMTAEQAAEGQRCASTWGGLLNQLGSNNVVRDLDRLRQALGEERLNFLGVSYGTRLGALYAHEFPESSGAIVLDAIVGPTVDMLQEVREGFDELVELQRGFFADCASGALPCPADARRLFDELQMAAQELGIATDVASHWAGALDNPPGREELIELLAMQRDAADSSFLLDWVASDEFEGMSDLPVVTVNCIDATSEPPSLAEVEALYLEFAEREPLFAYQAALASMCVGWPVTRDPVPLPAAHDAPTLLAIGGTHDWRTPFVEAQAMSAALGNARLVTSNHFGHAGTAWSGGCVQDIVRSFLLDAQLPDEGTVCE
jgi:pimeloyl-ACP methyl ester carboxylesterase